MIKYTCIYKCLMQVFPSSLASNFAQIRTLRSLNSLSATLTIPFSLTIEKLALRAAAKGKAKDQVLDKTKKKGIIEYR